MPAAQHTCLQGQQLPNETDGALAEHEANHLINARGDVDNADILKSDRVLSPEVSCRAICVETRDPDVTSWGGS